MRALLLMLAVLCLPGPALAAEMDGALDGFAVPPHLLNVDEDSATVAFRLRQEAPAEVTISGPEGEITVHSPSATAHAVRVEGLQPSTTYDYRVMAGQAATPADDFSWQIRTAPLPGESFSFAVYGDPRPGDVGTHRHHKRVLEQMLAADPAFALVLGDVVDDGSDQALWEEFLNVENPLARRAPLYPVLGDNDMAEGRGLGARYFPLLTGQPYAFTRGGVRFIGLNIWGSRGEQDSLEFNADSEQVQWLRAELASPESRQARFRVVFMHDPVRISRGRAAEVLERVYGPIFTQANVDVVFASWHLYERSHHDSVAYVITGGSGAELIWMPPDPSKPSQAEARRYHFTRVDVQAGAMTLRAVADDGTVLDQLTLTPRAAKAQGAQNLRKRAASLAREHVFGPPGGPELTTHLFATDCAVCRKLLEQDLPGAATEQGVRLRVKRYDLSVPGVYELFLAAGADFGRQGADVPALFIGRRVLGGESELDHGLAAELAAFKADPAGYSERAVLPFGQSRDVKAMGERAFDVLTLGIVLGAGLLDGLNPCAFATMVLLVSSMTLFGSSTRQLLATAGMFILGVFGGYLGAGLLFHTSLKGVLLNPGAAVYVYGAVFALTAVLAVLSAVDLFRALGSGETTSLIKLPSGAARRIQEAVAAHARKPGFLLAPLGLGLFIAGLELTCTGQVYLPIVTMLAEPARRATAVGYLVAYNVAFILPLLAVFGLAYFGVLSGKAAKSRSYRAALKLAYTCFFAAMTGVMAHNLGWI